MVVFELEDFLAVAGADGDFAVEIDLGAEVVDPGPCSPIRLSGKSGAFKDIECAFFCAYHCCGCKLMVLKVEDCVDIGICAFGDGVVILGKNEWAGYG